MKALFFLLTVAYFNSFTPVHDAALARFHLTQAGNLVQLNITFDLEDFSKSTGVKPPEVNLENMQNYLDSHTCFQFNSEATGLQVSAVKMVRDHIKVEGTFEKIAQKVKTINIENHCLTNVPRHSNIIQVDLNDTSKDYRMHEGRTVINLAY